MLTTDLASDGGGESGSGLGGHLLAACLLPDDDHALVVGVSQQPSVDLAGFPRSVASGGSLGRFLPGHRNGEFFACDIRGGRSEDDLDDKDQGDPDEHDQFG